MTAEHICEIDGCDIPAARTGTNIMSWCEKHLNERKKEERERSSPGVRTLWKQLKVRLPFTESGHDMCCSGKSHRERSPLRLSKLLGLSTFEYRAVPSPDGVYTIRRSDRGLEYTETPRMGVVSMWGMA